MTDLTKHYRYQRILIEAAQYRTLRQIFKADPEVTPQTAAMLRNILTSDRDDAAFMNEAATA
jgi:hypothetical protein